MNERREPDTEEGSQPETSLRKIWHAPRFVVSDLASTDAQGNGGFDAATSALSQS
jgi:hypothetical protein